MSRFLFLILFFCFQPLTILSETDFRASISQLDEIIHQKDSYDALKEKRIIQLKHKAKFEKNTDLKYQQYIKLYDEYKAYQYDSALNYADKSLKLAESINNSNYLLEARCARIFCMLSAGLFKEAFDDLNKLNPTEVSPEYRKKYLALAIRLNYSAADYNKTSPFYDKYIDNGNELTDSLLTYLTPESADWLYFTAQKQMKSLDTDKSIDTFERLVKIDSISGHTKAIAYSCIGWMYWQNGNPEKGMINLAESAKHDIRGAVKETTALCALGELLYKQGDIDRANEYVQNSLEDANFYGARHRKIEVNNILPIIENERYDLLRKQRNIIFAGGIVISILVVALSVALSVLWKQNKKIKAARSEIANKNERLTFANAKLKEVNKIKNEYIGNSFYLNARFIDKMESIYKTINRKVVAKQFNDINVFLHKAMPKEERSNMYEVFDQTFLKIFPNFVEKFNALFPEAERKYPDTDRSLTIEMRIFALIRLGVTDSSKIAQFLGKAVATITTYKTRVKNRSIVENDLFEKRIMDIGMPE